jgi:hypothetical protein
LKLWVSTALVLSALAATGPIAFFLRTPDVPEPQVGHRPIQAAADGYASSAACRACHPSEYDTWHASYHRSMTQVATPETVVANFDGVTVGDVHGRPMTLARRGREFWAEFDDPDANAAIRPRITRQVVMITGSHHQQVYWYATGRHRLLGQLPGIYMIAERRWIPRRSAVLHPPADPVFSETGHWNSTCIACHATLGKPEFDTPFGSQPIETQTVATTATEFGIACEACHGPTVDHARANRSPLRRYVLHLTGGADSTTVLPTRLEPRLSSQVCGQCHGVWEFQDPAGERQANSQGLPYRPGDELRTTRFVAQPARNLDSPRMQALLAEDSGFVADSFWPDGMVRVSGREYNGLIDSPCFRDARDPKRTLSCFSCHTMHKPAEDPRPVRAWADDQLAPGMAGDAACTQCHQPIAGDIPAHTKHRAGSSGSSCYNCHMPYTTYGLLKTIRSHQISSPSVASDVETGRPNACNLCHLDQTLAWTSGYLEQWYGQRRAALPSGEQAVSASLLRALQGDAGQRAIVAQAMGWPPAQQASGTAWMAPFLAQLLDDPYDAVRFIAGRSLRTLPEFHDFQYDFAAAPDRRRDAQRRVMAVWPRVRPQLPRADDDRLLIAHGDLNVDAVLRLLAQRNNRRMLLRE